MRVLLIRPPSRSSSSSSPLPSFPLLHLILAILLLLLLLLDPTYADDDDSEDEVPHVPWYAEPLQRDKYDDPVPISVALASTSIDLLLRAYIIRKNKVEAKRRLIQDRRDAQEKRLADRKYSRVRKRNAAEDRRFRAQSKRMRIQDEFARTLDQQAAQIDAYIDGQVLTDEKLQWLLSPEVRKVMHTQDTFAHLTPNFTDTDGNLRRLFLLSYSLLDQKRHPLPSSQPSPPSPPSTPPQ